MGDRRVQVRVTGLVQGVAFRASCQRKAASLGVTGWVRNCWDDSVEALFEGPADAVDAMVLWCHCGPPAAVVSSVEVVEAGPPTGPRSRSFAVRP